MNHQERLSLRHGPRHGPSVLGPDRSSKPSNQRIWCRVHPRRMTFAVVGCPPILVGKIVDISLGGLAFRHFSDIELDRWEYTVGILESGGEFQMSDLPCRKVYDILEPLSTEYLNFNITFRMKCCGLSFGNLTDEEVSKLQWFIDRQ